MVHMCADRLFVQPQVQNARLVSLSSVMLPSFEEGEVPNRLLLLLGNDSASVVVMPAFEQTARVILECVGPLQDFSRMHELKHSLMKYDYRRATFPFPQNLTGTCRIIVQGLSKQAQSSTELLVEQQSTYKLCGCSTDRCRCCPGFRGGFTRFSNADESLKALSGSCKPAPCNIANSNQQPGDQCTCKDGFVDNIFWQRDVPLGVCTPAPCNLDHSNKLSGTSCKCADGYIGNIFWNGTTASHNCTAAPCNLTNSNQQPGPACQCGEGYFGKITWKEDIPFDGCKPFPCKVSNSNGRPGLECSCAAEFYGSLTWRGGSWHGRCHPAPCGIQNSSKESGKKCKCKKGYGGTISWEGGVATGNCLPQPCNITNSNKARGPACACLAGFKGHISWQGAFPTGQCTPVPCNINGSTRVPGPDCRCLPGHAGEITWTALQAQGSCLPKKCSGGIHDEMSICRCRPGFDTVGREEWDNEVQVSCRASACDIPNSMGTGGYCICGNGFKGNIQWEWERNGSEVMDTSIPIGACVPAPCHVPHSQGIGLDCRCQPGYVGEIWWDRDIPKGECVEAQCQVDNSNHLPGPQCECLNGFYGPIVWEGPFPRGVCVAMPVCSDDIAVDLVLKKPVKDQKGVRCKGHILKFKGRTCQNGGILWTFASSLKTPRCEFEFKFPAAVLFPGR